MLFAVQPLLLTTQISLFLYDSRYSNCDIPSEGKQPAVLFG